MFVQVFLDPVPDLNVDQVKKLAIPVQFSHESIHNFLIISSNNTNKQTNKNHLRVRGIKLQIYSQHFLPSLVVWQVTYSDLCSELSVFVCVAIQVSNVTDACVFIN